MKTTVGLVWISSLSLFLSARVTLAQNLFSVDAQGGCIYEYTSSGVRSIYASGINHPSGLAFDSKGELFVANWGGSIIEVTQGRVQTVFATGLSDPIGLVFDSADNLFVGCQGNNSIYEYTPDGVRTTFASGLGDVTYLAFEPKSTPEPTSTLSLLAIGLVGLSFWRRR